MSRSRSLTARSLLSLALVVSHAARAQSTDEAARALFRQGVADYHLGEYDRAIDALKQGYRLSHAPGFLFNIAQAYRRKGDCGQALHFYREDLRAEPNAPHRKEVEDRIAEMTACEDARRKVVPAVPVEAVSAQAAPDPSRGRASRITGMTLVGVGVALAGAATYYAFTAAARSNDCTEVACDARQFASIDDEGKTASTLSTTFWIASGAALVSGVILWVRGARQGREVPVALGPLPGGGALSLRSQF